MGSVRHGIAVVLVVVMPLALGYWFAIHPFARIWRRIGPRATYSVLMIPIVFLGWWLYRIRETLIGTDLGTQPLLLVLSAVAFGLAIAIGVVRGRHLTHRILVGVPELSA